MKHKILMRHIRKGIQKVCWHALSQCICGVYKHVYDIMLLITDEQTDSQVLLPTATRRY